MRMHSYVYKGVNYIAHPIQSKLWLNNSDEYNTKLIFIQQEMHP